MSRKDFIRLVCFLFVSTHIAACGSNTTANTTATVNEGDVVAYEFVGSPLKSGIVSALQSVGLPTSTLKYDTDCYKLTYKTPDLSNALVNASGLVCLPKGKSGASPLISIQHGTIFYKPEAPTNRNTRYFWTGAAIASSGYITLIPDYLGYGASSTTPHPYMHAKTLSSTVVNMLRAAKHFLALPAVNMATNGQLFLAGYSEGGYATLAAQRTIELELSPEFTITASEPGAGAYDMTGTVQMLVTSGNMYYPAYAAFLVKSYDMIYNNPSQISYYFTSAQAGQMGTLFSGALNGYDINTDLGGATISTNSLFNPVFLNSYSGTGEATVKSFVAENNVYNWKPGVPTILFHGENDDVVPYANATTALQTMQANGATAVSIHNCDAGTLPTTHSNCGGPYLVDMMTTFSTRAIGL